ncbi:hypothetical protein ES332_D10G043700v1 [Gossypium tomentosum]|uniref:Uncharacterized protein n=1 Tax=Gossypium tomentosum TaxID=34277 RepID=A0A5D2IZS7_GOSTO|nr:hypothetical protein ES332_D10G043700v1 [Gossypium tomentosum]
MMYNTVSLHCNLLDGSLPACIEKFEWHKALCGVPRLQVLPCKDSTQLKYILPDYHLRDPANVLVLKYILPATTSAILLVTHITIFVRHRKSIEKLNCLWQHEEEFPTLSFRLQQMDSAKVA